MSTHTALATPRPCVGRHWSASIVLTMIIAAFGSQVAAQIRPVDLGTLGGQSSFAVALNASGQVVGSSQVTEGSYHAFLWTATDGMVDLGTLGGAESFAVAINDRGRVVGESDTVDGGRHAFSWTSKGGMIDLGDLNGNSHALAVTASGQVIGYRGDLTGVGGVDPFSWTIAGGFVDLGTLGGGFAIARAVNSNGQVVGVSSLNTACAGCPDSDDEHAFSWTAKGGMIDLGTLGGFNSFASAVNASGRVVGVSETADGPPHNFSWTATGGMVDLGDLGDVAAMNDRGQIVGTRFPIEGGQLAFSWTAAGGTTVLGTFFDGSGAVAVNATGQVVGFAFSNDTNEDGMADQVHGFSWTAAGGMIDLRTLGGTFSVARAVSANGFVVGSAARSNNVVHAALWRVIAKTVRPMADTFVRASLSSANFGDALTLRVKKGTTRRPYLKFDISQITDSDRVTLRLHGKASDAAGPVSATVYAVSDTSWNERTLTWNTRPPLGKVLGSLTVGGTAAQWVYVDVTKFVQSERRAGRNVISLALRSVVPSSAFAEFQSREAGDTGPRLVITDGGSLNR